MKPNKALYGLILLIAFAMCLLACKSTQTLQNTTEKSTDKSDSLITSKLIEINKAIDEQITLYNLQAVRTGKPECDSVTRLAILDMFRQMELSKQSGDNSYQLMFDELTNKLLLKIKVGETKNEQNDTRKVQIVRESTNTVREVPVERSVPKWQLFLFIAGVISLVLHGVGIVASVKSKIPFVITKKQ